MFIVLITAFLIGCSDSSVQTENEGHSQSSAIGSKVQEYIEEQNIDPLAVMDPSSETEETERTAVLFKNGLYEVSKNEDGSLSSQTHAWEERSGKAEFNTVPPYIFTVLKDEEIVEKGETLEVVLENGPTFTSDIKSERTPLASIFYYGDLLPEDTEVRASLYIYDRMGNEIYEKNLND